MLNYKTLFATLLLLSTHSIAAVMQTPQSQKSAHTQARFDASTLDKNNTVFNSNGNSYQIISQAYAVKSKSDANIATQNTQNTKNTPPPQWSKKLGHYQIIIPNLKSARTQAISGTPANNNHAVTYNNNNQQIGVIVGNIAVKFKGEFNPQPIADTYGLTITAQFERLNLVFFRVADEADIVLISQQLNADSAIERADIEILENIDISH